MSQLPFMQARTSRVAGSAPPSETGLEIKGAVFTPDQGARTPKRIFRSASDPHPTTQRIPIAESQPFRLFI